MEKLSTTFYNGNKLTAEQLNVIVSKINEIIENINFIINKEDK